MDVEFVPEPSPEGGTEDELGAQRPHRARWVWLVVVVALAAVAGGVVLQRTGHGRGTALPTTAAPASAATSPPSRPTGADQISTLDPMLYGVSTAVGSSPSHDVVQAARCHTVTSQAKRIAVITGTILRAFTSFTGSGVSRVVDRHGGLCTLQVRATDGSGDAVVVRISAPNGTTGTANTNVVSADATISGLRVEYANHLSGDGWHVLVGAVGRSGPQLPTQPDLHRLSTSSALRW